VQEGANRKCRGKRGQAGRVWKEREQGRTEGVERRMKVRERKRESMEWCVLKGPIVTCA